MSLVLRCRVCLKIDSIINPVIRATGICASCKPADRRQELSDDAEQVAMGRFDLLEGLWFAIREAEARAASMARLDAALRLSS